MSTGYRNPRSRGYDPPRPWCFPCRNYGFGDVWAQFLGIACEWHWGLLSPSDQAALSVAVRARHPRGGRARSVLEQIWVVRQQLRNFSPPNTVEKVWAADFETYQAEQAQDEVEAQSAL